MSAPIQVVVRVVEQPVQVAIRNTEVGGGGGGVSDHGALTGLGDDDHTQYHNDTRGDARYSLLGHTHAGYALLSGGNTFSGTQEIGAGVGAFESDIYRLRSTLTSDYHVSIRNSEGLSTNRTLYIHTGNANRTLTMGGDATISGTNTGDQDLSGYVATGGALGTPSSGTLTNCSGLPISTGVSGLGTGVATAAGNAVNASGGFLTSAYLTPSSLTSSASISWDVAVTRQPTLTLAHNTTITLSNLADGQTVSLGGTMGGSGGYTVGLAHSGLTVREMGGALADIAALAAGDLFEISCKRVGSDLRVWVSIFEI